MPSEHRAMYDGTYIFVETDNPNVFAFLREDEGPLGDYGTKPLEMYQAYITNRMRTGEISADEIVAKNIFYEDIEGVNAIWVWVFTLGQEPDYIRRFMHGGCQGGNLPS